MSSWWTPSSPGYATDSICDAQPHTIDPRDTLQDLRAGLVPHSFPAKLLALLAHRWQRNPDAPLSIFPCELIENNGTVLRDLVVGLARSWGLPEPLSVWLEAHCVWANSLVDRIVSEALEPVGAVAEPYALWAIERQARLQLPCQHTAIELVDSLTDHTQRKLYLLNGAHTFLAERWLNDRRPPNETVTQAMADPALRAELEALWTDEILPVFKALGQGSTAEAYVAVLRERLANPFLAHRLADIADNHEVKKKRRLAPVLALAEHFGWPPT